MNGFCSSARPARRGIAGAFFESGHVASPYGCGEAGRGDRGGARGSFVGGVMEEQKYVDMEVQILGRTEKAVKVLILSQNLVLWMPWAVVGFTSAGYEYRVGYRGPIAVVDWYVQKRRLA